MITSFLLKKRINPIIYSSNINFRKKKKQPPMQLCAIVILYYNMKLLKTPNILTTLEYP
jgi:hypothetical protein